MPMSDDLPVVELVRHPAPHPFVRRGLVARAPRLTNGAVVSVRSPDGKDLGDAFWNGTSEIALRRLSSDGERWTESLLEARLDQALALRAAVPGLAEATDALRLVHSEGDELSGLIVDRYGEVLCLELHSSGWVTRAEDVAERLHRKLGTRHHRIVLSERVARLEFCRPQDLRSPGLPDMLRIHEHGSRFKVDLTGGHKTGFFCDQRDNRQRFAQWAAGDVLDLCGYTGAFSIAVAAQKRAASVTSVDLDEKAVAVARENAKLNQVRMTHVHADAFDWLRQVGGAGRRWDSIVVDPPKFMPSRLDEETARGKYHDLNRLALSVLSPGGLLLTCSCSGLLSRADLLDLVTSAARKLGRRARLLASTGAGPDHPVLLECPETEYLKALWLRVW